MKTVLTALACALGALVLAGTAAGGDVGVTDDGGKFTRDPDAFYSRVAALGLAQNTFTVPFDPANPTAIRDEALIQSAVEAAARHDVKIVFAVGIGRARAITGNPFGTSLFAAHLKRLVQRFPTVDKYIVGNEGNVWAFWQPQYTASCKPIAGAAYEKLLAASYDALKDANPEIQVVGVGLSPRGNDNCRARSNISTSPVHYLANMGEAYRASGRQKPIMDALSFHPYPQSNSNDLSVGYRYPNAGMVNLDRIKQAFWDAFNGTAQPTFAEGVSVLPPTPGPTVGEAGPAAAVRPATLVLDEVGWQAKEPRSSSRAYRGRENVRLVSEAKQAQIYSQLVHMANCDAAIQSLNFFHLDDESDRDRFQSGLFRADFTARPSASAVRGAIRSDGGRCAGRQTIWRHATGVVGARALFRLGRGGGTFSVTAEEEATFRAGVFRVAVPVDRSQIAAALDGPATGAWAGDDAVLSGGGALRPYWWRAFRLSTPLARGTYVYAARLTARYNADRTSLLVSRPFSIG